MRDRVMGAFSEVTASIAILSLGTQSLRFKDRVVNTKPSRKQLVKSRAQRRDLPRNSAICAKFPLPLEEKKKGRDEGDCNSAGGDGGNARLGPDPDSGH
jgi:hypothetical protein